MRVVSLFSGAGGLDLGLADAGLEVVWANDIYMDAVATYRQNLGDHIDTRDICEIPSSEIPDCEVVVGGFPCQGFSVANWGRSLGDPRNSLYKQLVRVVADKRPYYFVGENVKGLASMGKGDVLRQIVGEFEALGYRVQHQVVNAADYGVPQMRKRLLIVGTREDQPDNMVFPPKPTHADPKLAGTVTGRQPWISVGGALEHYPDPDSPNDFKNHQCSRYKLRFNGHLGHRFIEPTKPAPTVTARGDEKGGVVVLHHPGNHRRMTARELAAVQSFPDTFEFVGTKTSAYRQVANAVPPLLGKAIGLMLRAAAEETRAAKLGRAA
jgi:DNA (cytosine-5)-methyltransferase 1